MKWVNEAIRALKLYTGVVIMDKIETITKEQLKKYRNMGFTSKEIAGMFNCSKHTINNRIKQFELQQSKEKDFDVEEMKRLVKEGYRVKEIAEKMGISYAKTKYNIDKIAILSAEEEKTLKNLFKDNKKVRLKLKKCEDLEFFEKLELKRVLKITMLDNDCCYEMEMIN